MFLDDCWIEAGAFLKRAVDESRGRYDIFNVRREIESGSQHLWLLFRGENEMILAATTMFCFYPLKKNLAVVFLGSNDDSCWIKHREIIVNTLEDFARENGCDGIEATGREGWVRVLSPFGWEKAFTVVEKDLGLK